MATKTTTKKTTPNSKERKQSQPVSRSYSNTKGEKITVLKNGTKLVNGVESGKVQTPAGTRMVMKNSGSSGLVKIGSKADAKYDAQGYYKKATYASPFANKIQTTTGIRNKDMSTQNAYNEMMKTRAGAITVPQPTTPTNTSPSITTPQNQSTRVGTGQPIPDNIQGGAVTVTSYKDNPDGTTTNTLSDGTTSTVRYIKNADGTLTPVEVGTGDGSETSPILDAEREFTAGTRQRLSDLESEKMMFDKKIEQLLKSNNALYQGTISSIKSTFDSRADALKENYARLGASRAKAQYQTDAFRYTPTHAEGLITNDENNMVMELADLDAQEQSLVLAATTAKTSKDWDALEAQMGMYDNIAKRKSELMGDLLTTATEQNRRIEAEKKIEREIAEKAQSTLRGDGAAKLAGNVAPVIAKAIKSMSDDEAIAYVEQKALELGIDSNILRSAVIDRGREDAAYARSLIPKAVKPTETELKNSAFGTINELLSGDYSIDGTPYKDPSGFLTVQGFKTLVKAARASNLSRTEFLENYGGDLNPEQIDAYGLTVKEKENLGY